MQYEYGQNGDESLEAALGMSVDWKVIASAVGHVADATIKLQITEAVLRLKYRTSIEKSSEITLSEGSGFQMNQMWVDVKIPESLRDKADEIVEFVLFCEDDYDHVNLFVTRVVSRTPPYN